MPRTILALSTWTLRKPDSPGQMAQLVGVWSHIWKCCGFDSQSGYIHRLWVPSPVGHIQEATDQCFSSLSLSLSLSLLSLLPFSLKSISISSINIALGKDKKRKTKWMHSLPNAVLKRVLLSISPSGRNLDWVRSTQHWEAAGTKNWCQNRC